MLTFSCKVLNCDRDRDFVAIIDIVENCRQMHKTMNLEVAAKIAVLDHFLKPGFILFFSF